MKYSEMEFDRKQSQVLLSSIDPILYSFPFRCGSLLAVRIFLYFAYCPNQKAIDWKVDDFPVRFEFQMLIYTYVRLCAIIETSCTKLLLACKFFALFSNVSLFYAVVLTNDPRMNWFFWHWMLSSLSNTWFHTFKNAVCRGFSIESTKFIWNVAQSK